jgi:transcriptional regulator with XRE-family HTH domain
MEKLRRSIKARRKILKLTQEEAARSAGMSRQQWQHAESSGNPSEETLVKMATALNCRVLFVPNEHYDWMDNFLGIEKVLNPYPYAWDDYTL